MGLNPNFSMGLNPSFTSKLGFTLRISLIEFNKFSTFSMNIYL